MNITGYNLIVAVFLIVSFCLPASYAVADDAKTGTSLSLKYSHEIYTGWTTDTEGQSYAYFGTGMDRIMSSNWALTAKVFGNYSYYKYDSDTDVVKARAPGLKLMLGTKHFRTGEYFIFSGGLDYRDTSLRPDDKGSSVRGSKAGFLVETLYSKDLTQKVVMDLIGSYNTTGDSLWGRARLKHMIYPDSTASQKRIFAGLEITAEGNNEYSAYRTGPFIELQNIIHQYSVLVAGGYKHTDSISDAGYFGIEFYHKF